MVFCVLIGGEVSGLYSSNNDSSKTIHLMSAVGSLS